MGKTKYTVANAKEYVEKICSYKLNDENVKVSSGVVFLFTKVPVNLALEVATQSLCNDSTLNGRTELSGREIILALKLCLDASGITFRGQLYMVMETVEEKALTTFSHPSRLWD